MSYFNDKLIKCDFEFQGMKVSLYKDVTINYNESTQSYILNDLNVDKLFIQIDEAMGFEIDLETLNALTEMVKNKSKIMTSHMDSEVSNYEEHCITEFSNSDDKYYYITSDGFKEWYKKTFNRDLKGDK